MTLIASRGARYSTDESRHVKGYLPQDVFREVENNLAKFGDEAVSSRTHHLIANAEKQQPYIKTHDVWGQRYDYDKLITSEGWKALGSWGARNG